MLQFKTAFYTITTRSTSRLLWQLNLSFSTNSAIVTTEPVNTVQSNHRAQAASNVLINDSQHVEFNKLKTKICSKFNIVPSVVTQIQNAQNVHDLLEVIKTPVLNNDEIAKIKQAITKWMDVNNKPAKNTKVESLIRREREIQEIKLAESKANKDVDLSTYQDLSTAEMIKEISSLTAKKKRNILLLNYLFQNILEHNTILGLGQCSSLLFSMSTLNYSDERLLKKICFDLMTNKDTISIKALAHMLKSIAFIRYKNRTFLKFTCNIFLKLSTQNIRGNKNIANALLSLAILGYRTEDVIEIIKRYRQDLVLADMENTDRLNLVWSLIIFKEAQISDIESVLNESYVSNLMLHDSKLLVSYQLKLLNINAYAKYALKDYNGPFLNHSVIPYVISKRSKQKELYIAALKETLMNTLPSSSYFKMNINTKMGFFLDAELYMDSGFKVVSMDNNIDEKFTKIGIMIADYYDTCLGEPDFLGLIKLHEYLLRCNNYRVIYIPYQHFGLEDRIEKRVSYLRRQLWESFNKSI